MELRDAETVCDGETKIVLLTKIVLYTGICCVVLAQ